MATAKKAGPATKRSKAQAPTGRRDAGREEPILALQSVVEWQAWLRVNHATSAAILLRIPKKQTGKALTYPAALDAALAWGWVDSQKRALDEDSWLQRFSRRSARSPWSKLNRTRAEQLIANGQMKEPGLAEVERAKRDGRWQRAYDGAKTSTLPDDLAQALAQNTRAKAFIGTLNAANRYAILYRVQTAKKPETRRERIQRFVAMCARHETIHPLPSKQERSARSSKKSAKP